MDIVRSEIGWLGYYGAEAYGLTWKVSNVGGERARTLMFCLPLLIGH